MPERSAPPTPMPLPKGEQRVLLFGGMFDPPHRGHVVLPVRAREAVFGPSEGWLVYVPAARSPHKPDGERAPASQRVAMLELALEGHDRCGIWTDEIDRAVAGEPSYWVYTARRARTMLGPDADLRFLIGADQAVGFHRWREPRGILESVRPVVLLREPWTHPERVINELEQAMFWNDEELQVWREAIVDVGTLDVSSTEIRHDLEGRLGVPPGWMDERVLAYIEDERLFASSGRSEERGG